MITFHFKGKEQSICDAFTPATEKNTKDFQDIQNEMHICDNLNFLKCNLERLKGKVKCVYLDPPYNTGKDFIFKDKRHKRGECKHSGWLAFMLPRLKLARELLREDGVIFVSIDDNEQANLKLLMDEVFGEENCIGQITISGNPRGRDYGGIARMHDYLLVYTKSENVVINNLLDENKEFPYQDSKGGFETRELRNRNIAFNIGNRPNLYYPFYINPNSQDENGFYEISLEKQDDWIELLPKESQGIKTVWRWGRERSKQFLNIEIVGKKMQGEGWQIVDKYREKTRMARSIWNDKDVNTEKGTLAVKELLNGKYFDFPKPVEMIKRIIEMGTQPEDIVLDFFAGSGTTGQAVMELNHEEIAKGKDGTRKFILVQWSEAIKEGKEAHKFCVENDLEPVISSITVERLRRAGEKYNGVDTNFIEYKYEKI